MWYDFLTQIVFTPDYVNLFWMWIGRTSGWISSHSLFHHILLFQSKPLFYSSIWILFLECCASPRSRGLPIQESNYDNVQTTLSNGYLGSPIDEERSEARYVMRIAEFSESSNLWTQMAVFGNRDHVSFSVVYYSPQQRARVVEEWVSPSSPWWRHFK